MLPLLFAASPNRASDLNPEKADIFPSSTKSAMPRTTPPEVCCWPGMRDDLGRRHHFRQRVHSGSDYEKVTLRVSDDATTETLEKAIAAAAIIGCRWMFHGKSTPMARGIMKTL